MDIYTSDSSDTDSREQKTLDYGRMGLTEITLEIDELDYLKKIDDDAAESRKYGITTTGTTIPIAITKSPMSNTTATLTTAATTTLLSTTTVGSVAPTSLQIRPKLSPKDIETILLNHNRLSTLPPLALKQFVNLKILDLSSNALTNIPDAICQLPLVTLIAKNNQLTNESLPKTFLTKSNPSSSYLKELNLSGNALTHFPEQVTELKQLRYLYIGGNQVTTISKDIWKMQSLQVLSLGGNLISEVPDAVGLLSQLQALVLCDNLIENLPMSIARLKNLKSLLLHKNRLKHLPKDIVALKNLTELSLRDNPLIVRFVQDIALNPPTLLELAARVVKSTGTQYGPEDLPRSTIDYLNSANCCVNPKCQGVFFDNRVEHIKFVDFCGKYRVPLLQYLCSSKCIEPEQQQRAHTSGASSGYMMRKVLLG